MDFNPSRAATLASELGADAISAYSVPGNLPIAGEFASLARQTESFWGREASTGLAVVPTVVTGWDTRPRLLYKPPKNAAAPSSDIRRFYKSGTPSEIAEELDHCLSWVARHPTSAPAGTILIYAWNENEEGGWLIPTYKDDTSRLDAIRPVLAKRKPFIK